MRNCVSQDPSRKERTHSIGFIEKEFDEGALYLRGVWVKEIHRGWCSTWAANSGEFYPLNLMGGGPEWFPATRESYSCGPGVP